MIRVTVFSGVSCIMKRRERFLILSGIALAATFMIASPIMAQDQCIAPDNGSGTVDLPADCPYVAPFGPMYIIEGLPPETTIELDPILMDYYNIVRTSGGSLGGQIQEFEATLDLTVTGTGDLSGFNRHLAVPVTLEVHTAPRNPGDPVQEIPALIWSLYGQLFGDPDFCELIIRGGTTYDLPGPGRVLLTDLGDGTFDVDSFFDVTYQIQFEGCPASPLYGYSGTTTASVLLKQGLGEIPVMGACCKTDGTCLVSTEAYCSNMGGVYFGDGTECSGDGDGDGYDDLCYPQGTCLAPDNGSGTVDLPVDCDFTAPYEPMRIIDGLPPNTTIELEPILMDFFCSDPPICSAPPLPPGVCEAPGGSLGGHFQCFEATLDLTVTGTGDLAGFNRHLAVPVSCEVHTGPRNPGDPVQTFPVVMYRFSGELFGDPDFCTLRITGGTDYGLPSPGQATLEDLGGGLYNIDSFFDITYQIEFEGCPASPIADYSGITTAMVRLKQGSAEGSVTGACCRSDGTCLVSSETYCQTIGGTYQGDESECLGDGDGDGYDDLCYEPGTCLAPDNETGTVDLPADCPYTAPDEPMYIIDGLPPETTIELEPIFEDFFNIVRTPGGSMGGQIQEFEATLDLTVTGTGELEGFNRHLAIPISCEVHTGPRNPGDPVQTFASVMFQFQGELFGDPDFCTLRITAGNDYGLPSPGYFTLTEQSGGYYAVDSFFDLTYQIEFEGCPASPLEDYSGTTTATVRLKQGSGDAQTPPVGACCELDGSCSVTTEAFCSNMGGAYFGDGTECSGDGDGDGYDDLCYPQGTCLAPDNGSGTVDLPVDCDFTAPYEPMRIIDGLPPNTTIELEPILMDFFCNEYTACSMTIPEEGCEAPGGSLGGHYHCFEATLDLTVTGTGDLAGFNRHLAVPVSCEVHTGPRNPGDPVQTFPVVMYRFSGELFGDPDFCTLRITGGTDYGLPSPGQATLEDLGGGLYNVDSFFDITYQIEFEGCPASVLDDYQGVTVGIVRLEQGQGEDTPPGACCLPDGSCFESPESYCAIYEGDWAGEFTVCLGDDDGDGYDDLCYEPGTCLTPDNEIGTVDLPADCPYSAPYEPMYIIDGLPPGTTIELEPIFWSFYCDQQTDCSLAMPEGKCEDTGGSLGGHYHCFEGALYLDVSGTGSLEGFNRNLAVPISCEVHTGPRNPGDPVQTFPTVMYRFSGELFGDPDFCTLRITAGSDYGLPSPGQMMLTDLGNGLYNVDSFFDITYQIEFEGCPASPIEDYSGTTTATIRLKQGSGEIPQDIPTLTEWGIFVMGLLLLMVGTVAVVWRRKAALSKAV